MTGLPQKQKKGGRMINLINANALVIPLADKSVHCIASSPPYWSLRDYGTAQWSGGDSKCTHEMVVDGGPKQRTNAGAAGHVHRNCKCGAIRIDEQLGLETAHDCSGWATGDDCGLCYICQMRAVMRECWRVLRDDGVAWINLGDSYAGSGGAHTSDHANPGLSNSSERDGVAHYREDGGRGRSKNSGGLKAKDLCMIPARFAMAAQADGWYLRSVLPWIKRNCMPESVTDRPTTAVEYVYMLTKTSRSFVDMDAIRVAQDPKSLQRMKRGWDGNSARDYIKGPQNHLSDYMGKTDEEIAALPGRNFRNSDLFFKSLEDILEGGSEILLVDEEDEALALVVNTKGYKGAHFATYPERLVEPLIMAASSEHGVCSDCGAPWERVTDRESMVINRSSRTHALGRTRTSGTMVSPATYTTTGWAPTCACEADTRPAIVLDMFAGSATTGVVARRLGRSFIGLDLKFEYLKNQARKRLMLTQLTKWSKPKEGNEQSEANTGGLPLFS
jgi:DNA modification methylase